MKEEFWQNWASFERQEKLKHISKLHELLAQRTINSLAKNGIKGFYAPDRAGALSLVMSLIPEEATVGFGDSVTLYEVGIIDTLAKSSRTLINPWEKDIGHEESLQRRRRALTCDVFLSGTNALTLDGKLVNIDGLGNRVAALIFGPSRVIVVTGVNKLVKDVDEAIKRLKEVACPLNAIRHNHQIPCGITGVCSECHGTTKMCRNTVIIEGELKTWFPEARMHVVIIGEELGF